MSGNVHHLLNEEGIEEKATSDVYEGNVPSMLCVVMGQFSLVESKSPSVTHSIPVDCSKKPDKNSGLPSSNEGLNWRGKQQR